MRSYKPMCIFDNSLKVKIARCWQFNRRIRWRYGTIRPTYYGVAVCIKGGHIRDEIQSIDIAEYISTLTINRR